MNDDTTLIDEVLGKIPNKYLAVVTASKRARVINDGSSLLVKTDAKKPTTAALVEIAEGALTPETLRQSLEAPIKKPEAEKLLPSPDSEDEEEEIVEETVVGIDEETEEMDEMDEEE